MYTTQNGFSQTLRLDFTINISLFKRDKSEFLLNQNPILVSAKNHFGNCIIYGYVFTLHKTRVF